MNEGGSATLLAVDALVAIRDEFKAIAGRCRDGGSTGTGQDATRSSFVVAPAAASARTTGGKCGADHFHGS